MSEYRQILTKAICGRGKKFSETTHSITSPENVYSVLGAWVINHNYKSKRVEDEVVVNGSYDLNIWYSTEGNTKTEVLKETVRYKETIPLNYYDPNALGGTITVNVTATQTPNCLEASVISGGGGINVRVEKEMLAEVTGETKVCVPVYPLEAASFDDKSPAKNFKSSRNTFENLDPDLLVDDLED